MLLYKEIFGSMFWQCYREKWMYKYFRQNGLLERYHAYCDEEELPFG